MESRLKTSKMDKESKLIIQDKLKGFDGVLQKIVEEKGKALEDKLGAQG